MKGVGAVVGRGLAMKWLGGVIQCVCAPMCDDAEAREASSQGKGKKARGKDAKAGGV